MTKAKLSLGEALTGVNLVLRERDGIQVSIVQRGKWLHLRATLPGRQGGGSRQQFIPLKVPATLKGVADAEAEARVLDAQMRGRTFSWAYWISDSQGRQPSQQQAVTFGEAIANYWKYREEKGYRSTLANNYLRYLPMEKEASPKELLVHLRSALKGVELNSSVRFTTIKHVLAFARWAKYPQETLERIKAERGNYSKDGLTEATLPSDETIVWLWESFAPEPHWQWAWGVQAAYGLRTSEIFCVDVESMQEKMIRVWDVKKLEWRYGMPLRPEWHERFEVNRGADMLPLCLKPSKTPSDSYRHFLYSQGVSRPGLLRHAWNIRAIAYGLPDSVAARMQGHSLELHTSTYRAWLSKRDLESIYEQAIKGSLIRSPSPDDIPGV